MLLVIRVGDEGGVGERLRLQRRLLAKVRDASPSGIRLGSRSCSLLGVRSVVVGQDFVWVLRFHVRHGRRGESVTLTVGGSADGGASLGCLATVAGRSLIVEDLIEGHLSRALSEDGPHFAPIRVDDQSRRNQQTLLICD